MVEPLMQSPVPDAQVLSLSVMNDYMTLYLEDLAIGQRFTSGKLEMTAEAIKAFAHQFDPQPFHLDEKTAEASFFVGLAASGWHTAAVTMRLLLDSGMPLSKGLIGTNCEIAWPRPTRPGDVLHVESEVLTVTSSNTRPDRGSVTVRSRTVNQRGEVVQSLIARMLVWRRPA